MIHSKTKIRSTYTGLAHWSKGQVVVILTALLITFPTLSTAQNADIVVQMSKNSFENTVTSLKKGITANKLVIVKEVPFTQMLAMVGVKAEKTLGLEIFHPRYGKVLHMKNKDAMLEAPLRILVRDEGGEISIRYRKPSATFAEYSGLTEVGAQLDKVFARIVASAM
ncbi:MAG: DUF302 domain-containing protein [Gammaproteobacteria bacterium]|nr:DUF302 domain-containing protein [Gammaproteobacteria bacterium]